MDTTNGGLQNMTEGSPARHIVLFALPLLAGSFLQQLYNMVDSWVVGQYVGDAALAAVGIGFPVIFMFTSLFMGLANGGTVVIAQFYGAGELDRRLCGQRHSGDAAGSGTGETHSLFAAGRQHCLR